MLVLALWLLVLAAVTTGVLAIINGWQSDRVRAGLELAASEILGHELRIGRLEGGLLDGLTLHEVSVRQVDDDLETSEALRVLRISVRIDGRASLRRRAIVFSDITIVQPRIALSRIDERGWLLAGFGALRDPNHQDERPPLPLAILVGSLQVSDIHLSLSRDAMSGLENIRGRLDVSLTGMRLASGAGLEWPNDALARLQVTSLGWRGLDFGTGHVWLRFDGPEARIESLELRGPLGDLAMGGAIEFTGPVNRPRARSASLRAHMNDLDLHPLTRSASGENATRWSRINGDLQIGLTDRKEFGEPSFDLDFQAILVRSSLFGGTVESADLSGAYRTGMQRWWLHQGSIELPAGRVDVSGTGIALRANRLDATARDIDLSLLPKAWFPTARFTGRADLDLALSGELGDPIGTLEARAHDVGIDDTGPSSLKLMLQALGERKYRIDSLDWLFGPDAGRLANTRIQVREPALFELGDESVSVQDLALDWTGGSMLIDFGARNGALLPSHIEVARLDIGVAARILGLAQDDPGGVVSGSIDVSGTPSDPDLRARLDWKSPRYRGLQADHILLELDGDEGQRTLEALVSHGGREQLRLAARLPRPLDRVEPRLWLGDSRTRIDLEAEDLDLAWLAPLFIQHGLEPAGRLDGQIQAAGGPEGPTAMGELRFMQTRLDRTEDEKMQTSTIVGPVSGSVSLLGRSARTEALQYGTGENELLLDGALEWSGSKAEKIDLALTVTGVGFKGRAILNGALRGDLFEPSVLTFSDFDVAELARRAGLAAAIGGRLTGELVVRGPMASPRFRTKLSWHEPEAVGVRAEQLILEAHSDDQTVVLRGGLYRSGQRVLDAVGSISLDRRRPIEAWVEQLRRLSSDPTNRLDLTLSKFSLDWLPVLAPGLPLKTDGFVEGEITLRGENPVIRIDGALTLDRGVFALATQTASVGPLRGTILFEGHRARFDRLTLEASRGSAVLAGQVQWEEGNIGDISLQADFEDYRFDQLGLFQSTLNGSLGASGALHSLHIGGNLYLGGIRIAFPSQEDPVLKEIKVLGLPGSQRSASIREGDTEIAGIETQSTVDVTITLPRGTWVRGIGLDAEIVGEVHVTKTAGRDLQYLGRMHVEHGRYSLQGKRFELDSGIAIFTGGPTGIPDVDIQAHRNAGRNVTIYAHVIGPANAPTLELSSQPPMDTAEIISYLFFGLSTAAGNRGSQGFGTSAASMAGSMLIESVAPELRETLRIDEISVTSGEGDEAPAVQIETQLTPDIYLRLIQSLGASADEAVEVRWRFWRGLSAKSKVSRSGASAIDLLWEFDYWGLDGFGLGGLKSPPPPYKAEAPTQDDCRPPLTCPPE